LYTSKAPKYDGKRLNNIDIGFKKSLSKSGLIKKTIQFVLDETEKGHYILYLDFTEIIGKKSIKEEWFKDSK